MHFKQAFLIIALFAGIILTGCSTPEREQVNSNTLPGNTESVETEREIPPLREDVKFLKLGDGEIKVAASRRDDAPALAVYFNMHDNENTSVDAARQAIAEYGGGRLVELRSTGKRLVTFALKGKQFAFDPNRIFTAEGIRKTLNEYGQYSPEAHKETERFANQLIKDYFNEAKLVIALHNNTEGEYSIQSYGPGGQYETDAADVFVNQAYDADDFFFVTDKRYFETLSGSGFNVALQDNNKVVDDGSFSVYCGKNNVRYINVEAEHGHLTQQVLMIRTVQNIIQNP